MATRTQVLLDLQSPFFATQRASVGEPPLQNCAKPLRPAIRPPAEHLPTYALDLALLLASIPSHHPMNTNRSSTTNNNSSSSSALPTPQTNLLTITNPELKIPLPR
ncbi:hypothetical protein PtA15_2A263 [Puccinia triticina]|uniref:Uncharacterized protein n=1 Tax=Puccinia triticina TaxID=208348 RepID=A0ABY7CDM0_9BASI|nr:uncharacterized protein PtA15_2A263 [Puccinia triticina]WAQ81950.1 hypothetical protein PtA15_2A263 [Puccinia triticina]WAR52831.1 hypothetical protein PtB15_2B259 [Puccinia triticina]